MHIIASITITIAIIIFVVVAIIVIVNVNYNLIQSGSPIVKTPELRWIELRYEG